MILHTTSRSSFPRIRCDHRLVNVPELWPSVGDRCHRRGGPVLQRSTSNALKLQGLKKKVAEPVEVVLQLFVQLQLG